MRGWVALATSAGCSIQGEELSEEGGLRNGFRPRRVKTAEGELEIEIPQVRQDLHSMLKSSCWTTTSSPSMVKCAISRTMRLLPDPGPISW